MKSAKLCESDLILRKKKGSQRIKTPSGMNKRNNEDNAIKQINQYNVEVNVASGGKKKGTHTKNKKRKSEQIIEAEVLELGNQDNESEDGADGKCDTEIKASGEKRKEKHTKNKKRKSEPMIEAEVGELGKQDIESDDGVDGKRDAEMKETKQSKPAKKKKRNKKTDAEIHKIEDASKQNKGESSKVHKIKKKERLSHPEDGFLNNGGVANQDEVYEISSGDEDSSSGMNRWIMEYHQSRPGAHILQQRIDDFIVAHEAQEEQARKEREAQAAEGGWTVVEHHKGRKKTTDAETGITVGSVAQASVMDKMAKKKSNNVGLDFYRFQRREAQRNEIMMLQSKFEQDKKRIQQLRAARKFRPF